MEESELEQSQESESFRLGKPSEVEGNIAWYETHLGQTVISVGLLVICLPLMTIFIKKKNRVGKRREAFKKMNFFGMIRGVKKIGGV